MDSLKRIEREYNQLLGKYPTLNRYALIGQFVSIEGLMAITDEKGDKFGEFDIQIKVPLL